MAENKGGVEVNCRKNWLIKYHIQNRGFEIRKSNGTVDIINPAEIDIQCGIVASGKTLQEAFQKICPHDYTDHGDFLRCVICGKIISLD